MKDPSFVMLPAGLRGKVAIVTGVSRVGGIGAAVCRAFAACGVDLLFTHWLPFDRSRGYEADEAGVAAIETELAAHGVQVHSVEVDLSSPESPRRVMDLAVECLGIPAILVNNAAHWAGGSIADLTAAELDRHYAVNVRAMALLCAEFVRAYSGDPLAGDMTLPASLLLFAERSNHHHLAGDGVPHVAWRHHAGCKREHRVDHQGRRYSSFMSVNGNGERKPGPCGRHGAPTVPDAGQW